MQGLTLTDSEKAALLAGCAVHEATIKEALELYGYKGERVNKVFDFHIHRASDPEPEVEPEPLPDLDDAPPDEDAPVTAEPTLQAAPLTGDASEKAIPEFVIDPPEIKQDEDIVH